MYMYDEKRKGYKEGKGIFLVAFICTWTKYFVNTKAQR